ncbi:MAG: FlgD immunoglobulin-like domain containing protein [Candidatus Eisenbacteria bacterium]
MRRAASPARLIALALLAAAAIGAAFAAYNPTTLVYPTFRHDLGLHHVNDFHLRLFTGNRHRFRDPRGIAAVKLIERDRPEKTGDDDELTVYGVNAGEHCIIYNSSETTIASHGEKGSGPGRFLDPWGIAANAAGDVYVADTGNDRIVHLRYRAGILHEIKTLSGARGDPVPFRSPRGVALASNGDLSIADTGNNRVVTVDRAGRLVAAFGGGLLSEPEAIAVLDREERWSCRPDDFLVVVDRMGTRVWKLRPDGNPIAGTTAAELGVPTGRFRGVAIDYHHQIYLTDETNHRVHKLTPELRLLTSFGREGSGDAEFQGPFGITVWRRFGQFLVSERTGAQYYWVGVDILDARADPVVFRPSGKIRFFLTERAQVTVTLRGDGDSPVRTLADERFFPAGERSLRWDGRDDAGETLAPGRYRVRIEARATYSSSKHFQKEVEFPITLG